jgi:hypothetical protein
MVDHDPAVLISTKIMPPIIGVGVREVCGRDQWCVLVITRTITPLFGSHRVDIASRHTASQQAGD